MTDETENPTIPSAVAQAVTSDALAYALSEGNGDWTPTDIRQAQCLQHFARTLNARESCRAAGVSDSSFQRWKDTDPGFARIVGRIIDGWVDDALHTSVRAAVDVENVSDRQFVLRHMRRSTFGERQVIEVVSPDVQDRLMRQADAIVQVCAMELPGPQGASLAAKLAEKLREIWA